MVDIARFIYLCCEGSMLPLYLIEKALHKVEYQLSFTENSNLYSERRGLGVHPTHEYMPTRLPLHIGQARSHGWPRFLSGIAIGETSSSSV